MFRRLSLATVAGVLLFNACGETVSPPVDQPNFARSQAIEDQFIVVLENNAPPGLERRLGAETGGVLFTYGAAIRGFAFKGSAQAAEALARNPWVAYVEQDREATLHTTQSPTPAWGIDRIDQRELPLDASYTYKVDGSGVNIYILDTGIRLTHSEFGDGLSRRANYIPNDEDGDFVGDSWGLEHGAEDCHGHGTHVAGTAAGEEYGVAKNATIYAGRVVNCQGSGTVSMAIAGVDWIAESGLKPAAVNMSLGYGDVQSLRDAVEAAVDSGFNFAVSAGNGSFAGIPQNACNGSPAGAPSANTVGATASNDTEASFSNYGPCVDILAPGVLIKSAYWTSDVATATMSGTSMSSPHVAGAIALYLHANEAATPAQVSAALTSNATANVIALHRRSSRGGTPNLLLYTLFIGDGSQNLQPTASFTYSCNDLTCDFDGSESSDDDGTIVSYEWDFGDGSVGVGVTTSHSYAVSGTYMVTVVVTDDGGADDTTTRSVSVTAPGDFALSAVGRKVKGRHYVDLTWSGATSPNVDIYRDGSIVATTGDSGAYTDATGNVGGATYVYQVCEAGTSNCSNTSTVVF